MKILWPHDPLSLIFLQPNSFRNKLLKMSTALQHRVTTGCYASRISSQTWLPGSSGQSKWKTSPPRGKEDKSPCGLSICSIFIKMLVIVSTGLLITTNLPSGGKGHSLILRMTLILSFPTGNLKTQAAEISTIPTIPFNLAKLTGFSEG